MGWRLDRGLLMTIQSPRTPVKGVTGGTGLRWTGVGEVGDMMAKEGSGPCRAALRDRGMLVALARVLRELKREDIGSETDLVDERIRTRSGQETRSVGICSQTASGLYTSEDGALNTIVDRSE
jgi:hypothetical protein